MATRFLRGPPTLNAILARKNRLRRKSRRTEGDEDAEDARVSISAAEFSTESDHLVERGTFRDWVVTHPSASLSTLPGLYFPRLPLVFLFSSLRFSFFRPESICTGAKLSVISDGMARLTLLRFYAPTWITRVNVHCTCELDVENWKKSGKCSDASIIKSEGGKKDNGMRADSYTTKFIIFNYFLFPPGINGRSLKLC